MIMGDRGFANFSAIAARGQSFHFRAKLLAAGVVSRGKPQPYSAGVATNPQPTNKNMKLIITALSAFALASTLTFAEEKPAGPGGGHGHPNPAEIFKKLDTNNDSSISLGEFQAGPRAQKDPAKAAEIFKKLDKDNSGGVSLDEFKAGRPHGGCKGHGGKGHGGKGSGPGGGTAPAAA